tara:strand:- start:2824 stop:3357 length:534 start_codon:yes stop_codon:yes gene_type:complete
MKLLREYIRSLLNERIASAYGQPSFTKGKKNVYRGMKLTMPSASLASAIRRGKISGDERARLILGQLQNESTGVSWSETFHTAVRFADVWDASNRGKTIHVILQATIDDGQGYDPITAGQEPRLFWDENEIRMEPGAAMPITAIYLFIKRKDKFASQESQFDLILLKDEESPMMVKA